MLNVAIIMGRMVADPELRTTQSGISVTSFRIAVDRPYSSKDSGQRQADFIDIVAWRNTAEFVCKYFAKGQMIALQGRIQTRSYEDKQGNKRTAVEVVADNVNFCGSKQERQHNGQPRKEHGVGYWGDGGSSKAPTNPQSPAVPQDEEYENVVFDSDYDLPF